MTKEARDRARAERAFALLAESRAALAASEQRAARLEAELAALRSSASFRLAAPLRHAAAAVPRGLYGRLRFGRSPVAVPERPLAPAPSPAALAADARLAQAIAQGRPIALLVDEALPEADRDSGSVDIFNLAAALASAGLATFFATTLEAEPGRAAEALAGAGVTALAGTAAALLARHRDRFALVVLNRVYCGGHLFEQVRADAPRARIVFNTIDLHWIRLEREAALRDDARLMETSREIRAREIALAGQADATLVVSDRERAILLEAAPDAHVVALPLARPDARRDRAFEERDGIGFIGGFRHAPNLDAMRWLVGEIWPHVLRRHPDARLSVVGADLPPGLLDGVGGRVEYLGQVPDTAPWFASLRATVAPLRFGAGVKGKIVSSLAAGVPVVATTLAVEGMGIGEGQGVRIADDPAGIADALLEMSAAPQAWRALSDAASAAAQAGYSMDGWRERVEALLASLGVAGAD